MADLQTIYEDKTAWVTFTNESEGESIRVYRRCQCGRYLKTGEIKSSAIGGLKFEGWDCKKCGEVEPFFERI